MAKGDTFQVSVVTPEGAVLEQQARSATFPAYDGEMGILPNHAPLLAKLGIGVLRVVAATGETHRLYVDGGFAQVADNKVSLLTEQACALDELEAAKVPELFEEARSIEARSPAEFEARAAAYQRARVQRRLTSMRK